VSSTKPFYDATLLAQFEAYGAIHRAGVALDLWTQWERPTVAAIDAIADMLRKHAGIDPQKAELSFVATFLQQQVDRANGVKGTGTAERSHGKRPLEQSNPLKLQIYERIRQEHMRDENHLDTVTRLKEDKNFMEQVKEAGEMVNTKLVRKALAFFDQRDRARKQQETDPT
jgi:hypothetical protein